MTRVSTVELACPKIFSTCTTCGRAKPIIVAGRQAGHHVEHAGRQAGRQAGWRVAGQTGMSTGGQANGGPCTLGLTRRLVVK